MLRKRVKKKPKNRLRRAGLLKDSIKTYKSSIRQKKRRRRIFLVFFPLFGRKFWGFWDFWGFPPCFAPLGNKGGGARNTTDREKKICKNRLRRFFAL